LPLSLEKKHVTIIGAGVAGLTAADRLAERGIRVSLLEKTPFPGGHAIQLTCKATDACVRCGACLAEDKLLQVDRNPNVQLLTGTRIEGISGQTPFTLRYRSYAPLVNAEQCNGCGICLPRCPIPGAILQGRAPRVGPYVAIRRDLCLYFENDDCTLCRDSCPQGAIHLTAEETACELETDALLIATGFKPYNPVAKPYGYGLFQNVLTSLDAERVLRDHYFMKRPSDDRMAQRIAFIQCVGSRDAKLGHPWCSKICCGSSLRMARLIQSRQKDAQITFFYIDVQTFGKNFQSFYAQTSEKIKMIRAIPGDILNTDTDELKVLYFDPETRSSTEAPFDLVVLSVGLTPPGDNVRLTQKVDWSLDNNGFISREGDTNLSGREGIFITGTATGPMTIAETISSAEKTAFDMIHFLGER
jgi:heterodisulfide reductase subunit A